MAAADLTDPKRKRRSIKFSLRSLIIGVGLFAIWLGWWVNTATRQARAVRAILARGGTVAYDYQFDATVTRRLPDGEPSRPAWLQRLLSDDYFHRVVLVGMDIDKWFHDIGPTDADLVHLEELPHLKLLYLGGGRVTDHGLEHLRNLTELRLLILWRNPISGQGLKHLSRLRKLQHLDLSQTPITDNHLIHLKNLTGLERIDIAGNTQVTGAFLDYVADLPHLQSLVLRGSGITDSALVHLKRAKSLQSLMLDRTRVTDAGMVYVRTVTSLRSLDLSATAVSPSTVEELGQRFPQASILPKISKQPP